MQRRAREGSQDAPVGVVHNESVVEGLELVVPDLDVDERRLSRAHHANAAALVEHELLAPI